LGKYDGTRYLKRTKARAVHHCDRCNDLIEPGEYYYAETQKDRFLHSLHAKRLCSECYEKDGNQLLSTKAKKKREIGGSTSLRDFFSGM